MKKIRIDRLLANLGYGSRRELRSLLMSGAVSLDGSPVLDPGLAVPLGPGLPARLTIRDEALDPLPGLLLLLHKPKGVVCSRSEEEGRSVFSLLPERWQRRSPPLSSIGRLDKESSGLLLLTDDGALLHRIQSPKAEIWKRYEVELARDLRGDEEGLFRGGLRLRGETEALRPARFRAVAPRRAVVEISEGRYHQVRRMFAAVGNHVEDLTRTAIGGLELPRDLEAGSFTILPGAGPVFTS